MGKIKTFRAGALAQYCEHWSTITGDLETLETVAGLKIDFVSPLKNVDAPSSISFDSHEKDIIQGEIKKLQAKGVIQSCRHEEGEFISPIFLVPKDGTSFRMILNLKKLNQHLPYIHFKMDTFNKLLTLIRPNYFFCSVDIKDAYYSVAIQENSRKYLKFEFQNQLYRFLCLPNGLCSGPRKFTKLLKPALAFLRKQGYIVSAYIDDIIIMDDSFDACIRATIETIKLLDYLGFVIHPTKSVLIPSKTITYLGFVINSQSMTVTLPQSKIVQIKEVCTNLCNNNKVLIRNVASTIGFIVSTFPAVKFGPLNYRALEHDKIEALKCSQGDYNHRMVLSKAAYEDLRWWITSISNACNNICVSNPDSVITTDASSLGWGAIFKGKSTRGTWTLEEQKHHINVLELKAILFGLKSLVAQCNTHIKILTDNMNAVYCIRNMGSCRSTTCNDIVKDIWSWAIKTNNWLSVSFIPGVQNDEADFESRHHELQTEWQLNPSIFKFIVRKLSFNVDIDLFASRINCQLKPFVSFWPDPEALAVDSFTFNWSSFHFYAFPPFAVIPKVLQKIEFDQATGLVIVPEWPYSSWYSQYNRLLVSEYIIIPCSKSLLMLPSRPEFAHPLYKSLHLRAGILSGKKGSHQVYFQRQRIS